MNEHDSRPTLLQIIASPTSTAGAIVGGTLGAFTIGPVGAVAGMVAGSAAAIVVERVAGESARRGNRAKHPTV